MNFLWIFVYLLWILLNWKYSCSINSNVNGYGCLDGRFKWLWMIHIYIETSMYLIRWKCTIFWIHHLSQGKFKAKVEKAYLGLCNTCTIIVFKPIAWPLRQNIQIACFKLVQQNNKIIYGKEWYLHLYIWNAYFSD